MYTRTIALGSLVKELLALNCPLATIKALLPIAETFKFTTATVTKLNTETAVSIGVEINSVEMHNVFKHFVTPALFGTFFGKTKNASVTAVYAEQPARFTEAAEYEFTFVIHRK